MPPITPEDFIHKIAEEVVRRMQATPPKPYDVNRVAPNGQKRVERVVLHQAITELTDSVQAGNELMRVQISLTQALIGVLEENRVVGKQILKQNSRNLKDED